MFTENSSINKVSYVLKNDEAGYKTSNHEINKPLTVALDSMGSHMTSIAGQDIDREIAAHLFAIACKIKALSKHLKASSAVGS